MYLDEQGVPPSGPRRDPASGFVTQRPPTLHAKQPNDHLYSPSPMLLAIDAGNTNIVFGLHDGETWRHVWRLETHPLRPFAEYGLFLQTHLLESGLRLDDISRD